MLSCKQTAFPQWLPQFSLSPWKAVDPSDSVRQFWCHVVINRICIFVHLMALHRGLKSMFLRDVYIWYLCIPNVPVQSFCTYVDLSVSAITVLLWNSRAALVSISFFHCQPQQAFHMRGGGLPLVVFENPKNSRGKACVQTHVTSNQNSSSLVHTRLLNICKVAHLIPSLSPCLFFSSAIFLSFFFLTVVSWEMINIHINYRAVRNVILLRGCAFINSFISKACMCPVLHLLLLVLLPPSDLNWHL